MRRLFYDRAARLGDLSVSRPHPRRRRVARSDGEGIHQLLEGAAGAVPPPELLVGSLLRELFDEPQDAAAGGIDRYSSRRNILATRGGTRMLRPAQTPLNWVVIYLR